LFSKLGKWNPELQSPVWSLAAQCGVILLLMLAVGTAGGRNMIDAGLVRMRLSAIPWDNYGGGFDTLVAATAPIFWTFFLLTTLALFLLRQRDAGIERPFPVPLYPVLPIIFSLVCAYMLYASGAYAGGLVLLGVGPLLLGVPLYFWTTRMASRAASGPRE
jgi:amino acid transporter